MFKTSHFLWMGITVLVILITSFLLARFLQIFFLFYQYTSKNEQRKADLNGFMCMCMAVGAPFAILLHSSSVSFSSPVAYHMPLLLKNRGRDDVRTASVR